ncbi:hypothetical protein pb186bvf_014765 [Paramecium bursaria]
MFKIAKPIQEPIQEHINIFQQPQPQLRIRNPSPWNVVGPVEIYNNMNNKMEIVDDKKDKRPKFIIRIDNSKLNQKKESVQMTPNDKLSNNDIEKFIKDAMKREYDNEQKRLNLLTRVPQEIRLRLTKQERCLRKLENMQSTRLNDSQIFSQKVGRDRQKSLMEKSADFRGSSYKNSIDNQEDRRHWYHSLRSKSSSAQPIDDIFHSFATKTTRSFYKDQANNQISLRSRDQLNEVVVGQRKLDLEMSQIHPNYYFKMDNEVLKKDQEEVYARDWDPQMKIMGFNQLYELIQ